MGKKRTRTTRRPGFARAPNVSFAEHKKAKFRHYLSAFSAITPHTPPLELFAARYANSISNWPPVPTAALSAFRLALNRRAPPPHLPCANQEASHVALSLSLSPPHPLSQAPLTDIDLIQLLDIASTSQMEGNWASGQSGWADPPHVDFGKSMGRRVDGGAHTSKARGCSAVETLHNVPMADGDTERSEASNAHFRSYASARRSHRVSHSSPRGPAHNERCHAPQVEHVCCSSAFR